MFVERDESPHPAGAGPEGLLWHMNSFSGAVGDEVFSRGRRGEGARGRGGEGATERRSDFAKERGSDQAKWCPGDEHKVVQS